MPKRPDIHRLVVQFMVVVVLLAIVRSVLASPPPNDNFANATTLDGSSITFTGNLTGATFEQVEPYGSVFGTRSIWWKWTAPADVQITVEQQYGPEPTGSSSSFALFSGTNLASLTELAYNLIDSVPHRHFSFFASSNTTYYIRVLSLSEITLSLKLSASDDPIILMPPQSRTVSTGASVALGVLAASAGPLAYQWYFGGQPLAGETAPTLVLYNLTTNQSGVYFVTMTDTRNQSAVAQAEVNITDDVRPVLQSLARTNGIFVFRLNGEAGRAYALESTANLAGWASQPLLSPGASVFLNTNAVSQFTIQAAGAFLLLRTRHYVEPNEGCSANLRQIRWAKNFWAVQNRRPLTDVGPTPSNLAPYVKNGNLGLCPEFGSYVIGDMRSSPVCSHIGHGSALNY